MFFKSFIFGTLLAVASAAPTALDYVVHEKRNVAISMWEKRAAVPSDMSLPMRIGLKQGNLDRGYDLLMDVSSHDSPSYGKYYSAEEVVDLFAPAPETVDAVRAWLEEFGISRERVSQSYNKGWIQFDAPAGEAEKLLNTKFHYFEHKTSGDANIACDEYHVPGHIQDHIDYITPGVKLASTNGNARKTKVRRENLRKRGFKIGPDNGPPSPIMKPLPAGIPVNRQFFEAQDNGTDLSTCDTIITPACIRAMYKIPVGNLSNPDNQLGIYESGDVYAQHDLDLFFGILSPSIPQGTGPDVYGVDGGTAPVANGGYVGIESSLDLQLAYPIVYPQGVIVYQVDDSVYSETFAKQGLFNNFLDAIDGSYCTYSYDGETGNDPAYDFSYPDPNPDGYQGQLQCGVYKSTNVISISYGVNEADYTIAYQERQCQEWMKLGLQGVSVVLASGDSGVGGREGQNGHENGCLGNGTIFNPDYPGTCPYMTTAGSTFIPTGGSATADDEIATTSFSSGGGFSNLYAAPGWQKEAIDNYFRFADPIVQAYPYYSTVNNASFGANGGIYNRGGRGYPDVAAVGDNVMVFTNGQPYLVGGTSASAPVFASILTRINDERLAAGKSTVGFVNPVLYAHPEAFHDITTGNNSACDSAGFIAGKGWDPVTGLGTPIYPKLLSVFMGLD